MNLKYILLSIALLTAIIPNQTSAIEQLKSDTAFELAVYSGECVIVIGSLNSSISSSMFPIYVQMLRCAFSPHKTSSTNYYYAFKEHIPESLRKYNINFDYECERAITHFINGILFYKRPETLPLESIEALKKTVEYFKEALG